MWRVRSVGVVERVVRRRENGMLKRVEDEVL